MAASLSWRWQAALAAGLTEELERLRFAWRLPSGVPGPSARLVFRHDADDEEFADLFRRTLTGTLDATTRRAADAVGADAQARADVAFYRDRMHGERDWWLVACLPGGEPVGFGIPSRNTEVPVVGYIGTLPGHRGRGYIDDILAETTRVLADRAGAELIHADTDLANRPMAAAFERAGYVNFARRVVLSAPHSSLRQPARIACSTGLSGCVSGNSPCRWTPGCARIRGPFPVCGQVAACTRNGWHRNMSPASPVANTVGRCSLAFVAARAARAHAMPPSPARPSTRAASQWEPSRILVGALASSTSLNRYRISRPRARDRMLTHGTPFSW
ncbi:MAG: GNAT family N-acetyltransferase [Trebonia sp.]